MGAAEWFLPAAGENLGHWLYLAHFGLGVLLRGLFFGCAKTVGSEARIGRLGNESSVRPRT